MKRNLISRRNFIRNTALTTGVGSLAPLGLINSKNPTKLSDRFPAREIWIAGVSEMGLEAESPEMICKKILETVADALPYQPDFICLPEAFPFLYISQKYTQSEKVEISMRVLERFSEFSKQNNCYIICPVYTPGDGGIFNSAVIIDRKGKRAGIYNKIHPTEDEIRSGINPGALFQPVIQTDSGPVGIQICFDMNWDDGWGMYRDQGAKIIFWPSAYAGGTTVNTKAWQHKCVVASGTQKNTSKLCDITGQTITQTGIWNKNLYCGPVNMEKAFLATWPYVDHFKDIQNKYGRKIRITNFHEEEWSIIESLSVDVSVSDILKEFNLRTWEEHMASAEMLQKKTRK